MRILIAPDAFKASLTSPQAAEAMAAGITSVRPDFDIVRMPLADGGEGTLDIVHAAIGGDVDGDMLWPGAGGAALIESARFIGLTHPAMQQSLFERGSQALGAAIIRAVDKGASEIRIGLGGSATVDGGLGLLMALGCAVSDQHGHPVSADLNGLLVMHSIDIGDMACLPRLTVLSDVDNPLLGVFGAVRRFGPQKGLPVERLAEVEVAMARWADRCEDVFGISVKQRAGAGAAGGLGFALQLLGGEVVSGADDVMDVCGFEQQAEGAEWVVTGEGRSDAQTRHGKLPWRVAVRAKRFGASVALISGDISDEADLRPHFDRVISTRPRCDSVEDAMRDAAVNLKRAAAAWAASL